MSVKKTRLLHTPLIATTTVLGVLGGSLLLGTEALGYDGRGGILPAHLTTTDSQMRGRGGAVYRNYREVVLRQGEAAGRRFTGLHPFVQNTYGQPVPIIGVSAGTQSGRVGTASGGVVSNEQLSSYLQGRGPAPAGVTATLDAARQTQLPAARPGAEPVFMHQSLLRQAPKQAAAQLVAAAKELLPKLGAGDVSARAEHTSNLRHLLALGLRLPGQWQKVTADRGSLVLAKSSPQGQFRITYLPGNALSLRVERADRQLGYDVIFQSQGTPGRQAINLASTKLIVQRDDPNQRFVPASTNTAWLGLPVTSSFQNAFGL